uniref:Transmembrane protein n=2 Tax=Neospora caninum (strain Liverpool) TaxID=572307 RepID=A0A0F7U5I6_NEOCL|nr:TPA: hypothetical protein BN1204_002870 [Neospora caninum Liverpool]
MSQQNFHVPFFFSLLVVVSGTALVLCSFLFLPATASENTHVMKRSDEGEPFFSYGGKPVQSHQAGKTESSFNMRLLQDVGTVPGGGTLPNQYIYVDTVTTTATDPGDKPSVDGTFTDTLHQAAGDAMDALDSVTQQLADMGLEPWQIALITIAAGAAILCLLCCCMRCLCRGMCCCAGK